MAIALDPVSGERTRFEEGFSWATGRRVAMPSAERA
jgi:hypothetical protein